MLSSSRAFTTTRLSSRILCRYQSTTAAAPNQSLYLWGTNSNGSLMDLPKLVDVPTLVDWRLKLNVQDESVSIRQVVCGPTDTAIVLSNGQCFVSGANKQGQLGLGHKNVVTTPTLLPKKVKSISLGLNSSSFLDDEEGELYTCGFGGSTLSGVGQLGHGDSESTTTPKLVHSIIEDGCYVKEVGSGECHTTILTTEGEVLCTGAGSYGRLGNFDTVDQMFFEPAELLTSGVEQISVGKSFTLALRDGVVFGWGRNHKGQLGTGYGMAVDMYAMSEVPTEVASDELMAKTVKKIAAGHSLAACITTTGDLYYWGMSLYLEPEFLASLVHTKIVDVGAGNDFLVALDQEGKLYSFGNGSSGSLGRGGERRLNQAQLVEALSDKKVKSLSVGWKHVAAIVEE